MGKHSATDGQDDRDSQNQWGGQDPWNDQGLRGRQDLPRQDRPDPGVPGAGGYVSGGPIPSATPGTGRRRRGPADDGDHFVPVAPVPPSSPLGPVSPYGVDGPGEPRDPAGPPPYTTGGPDAGPGGPARPRPERPAHPEHGAWGASDTWSADRPGRRDLPFDPVEEWAADWAPYDTASALSSPAAHGALPRHGQAGRVMSRPRQEFLDAFDAPAPRPAPPVPPPAGTGTGDGEASAPDSGAPGRRRTRALTTGVAAVTALAALAVLAGTQLHRGHHRPDDGVAPGGEPGPSADETPTAPPTAASAPSTATAATPASYDTQMARQYPLDPHLSLSGAFTTVPGHQDAPGKGRVTRFRVDVEKGLDLDPALFSDAVFTTLNDPRGWGHGGTMTFERVSSGPADIVVTLASPGTTAKWCARSGLDTTVDNVSCDSASTPRTMINAYRWAQGAATYGPDRIHAYRQMLVNHEVGHRLGHDHVGCPRQGAPAPVMMQQTKFLSLDGGPTCVPNPWPFP
ncbi:hypothetical protein RVR_6764 [Actinacidiphila reveromycinica]|uniref:DUF3152 domain-containing protein n=1 Tax=Actinacidiphila reveromycinica TaxID=659352 RepID=A0A7U3VQQ2_9ACTN|nr:DUF3152 domain-containing protein [Streptomyces sp. SN-593]BBA99928.1 hypothetical protein RVR_6764 [Streptomyces sp. SN-593]